MGRGVTEKGDPSSPSVQCRVAEKGSRIFAETCASREVILLGAAQPVLAPAGVKDRDPALRGPRQFPPGFPTQPPRFIEHSLRHIIEGEAVARACAARGLTIARSLVGNYCTSLEMAGVSVTLTRLTPEMMTLWDAPARTPALTVP